MTATTMKNEFTFTISAATAAGVVADADLTLLHFAGSSDTEFYFEASLLYAQAACRFQEDRWLGNENG